MKIPKTPCTLYISKNTGILLINETTLVLTGNGFDASSPSANAIILSNGAQGTVTAATATSLTVELTKPATTTGPLKAVVRTAGGHSSGEEPFQVATLAFPEFSGLPESANWRAIAASEHGDKLVAVAQGGAIWTSKDRGATWRASTTAPIAAGYVTVDASADGSKIVAGVNPGGKLWLSEDSGATFFAAEPGALPAEAPWNGKNGIRAYFFNERRIRQYAFSFERIRRPTVLVLLSLSLSSSFFLFLPLSSSFFLFLPLCSSLFLFLPLSVLYLPLSSSLHPLSSSL